MSRSMVAPHNRREYSLDPIFDANTRAQEDVKRIGKDKVVCGTVGAIMDEDENHVFLQSVRDTFLHLEPCEYSRYAPISGTADFLNAVEEQCFSQSRPEGFIRSAAVCGGTGGLHHLVQIYTEPGDKVLTADWHWGAYKGICSNQGCTLATYELLDENMRFNMASFKKEVLEIAKNQKNVVLIINTPAHNPTGYSISMEEWDGIIAFLKELVSRGENNVVLGVDVAYLDYAGEKEEVRKMFKKFENLPPEILTIVIYSLSKGYTFYGQRAGANICISSDESLAEEFYNAHCFASRSTWSNVNRPAMATLVEINKDKEKQRQYEEERNSYRDLIAERAEIFMQEAKEVGVKALPYMGGFFLTLPFKNAKPVCAKLEEEHIYIVPMENGIRIAACSVSKRKMRGLAQTIKRVMDEVGE